MPPWPAGIAFAPIGGVRYTPRPAMDHRTKRTVGSVAAGCGCVLLLALTAWLGFVIYIGIQGRGNDEEASLVIGAITCCVMVPVIAATIVGLFLVFKKPPPDAPT